MNDPKNNFENAPQLNAMVMNDNPAGVNWAVAKHNAGIKPVGAAAAQNTPVATPNQATQNSYDVTNDQGANPFEAVSQLGSPDSQARWDSIIQQNQANILEHDRISGRKSTEPVVTLAANLPPQGVQTMDQLGYSRNVRDPGTGLLGKTRFDEDHQFGVQFGDNSIGGLTQEKAAEIAKLTGSKSFNNTSPEILEQRATQVKERQLAQANFALLNSSDEAEVARARQFIAASQGQQKIDANIFNAENVNTNAQSLTTETGRQFDATNKLAREKQQPAIDKAAVDAELVQLRQALLDQAVGGDKKAQKEFQTRYGVPTPTELQELTDGSGRVFPVSGDGAQEYLQSQQKQQNRQNNARSILNNPNSTPQQQQLAQNYLAQFAQQLPQL